MGRIGEKTRYGLRAGKNIQQGYPYPTTIGGLLHRLDMGILAPITLYGNNVVGVGYQRRPTLPYRVTV